MTEFVDVVIVGAGISGISAAWHLQDRCPDKSYVILERRENLGGTWDLFKYPGIRSDSDMFTLGFRFKPWTSEKAIADGPSIMAYLKETVAEYGIDKQIRYGHKVAGADWSDDENRWTVRVQRDGQEVEIKASFLFACSGYYNYDEGYSPEFAGSDDFEGTIIHPQHWPDELDYAGKKIVVIGSGATAVTLIPALVDSGAGHVTMAQRRLPEGYDVEKHFGPSYNPWDQRLCLAPNGDLFKTIRSGKADVVTDKIDRFTKTGIKLASGEELQADIIVTATGLNLQLFGGAEVSRNGVPIELN